MIYIKLWGGLGNQLFQYSYGYKLAKKMKTGIVLDISYYEKYNLRSPVILSLNISYDRIINNTSRHWIIRLLNSKQVNRIIRLPRVFDIKIMKNLRYLKETRRRFMNHIQNYNYPNVYIDGYWQAYEYLSEVKEDIVSLLSIQNNKFSDILIKKVDDIKQRNYVSLHIRRGDYVKNRNPFSNLVLLEKSYFDYAINEARKMFVDLKFLVFSDDVDWVKKVYNEYYDLFEYVEGFKDYEELMLMSSCSHNIISNSTFSWWAAYTNQNVSKIVWCPSRGFGNMDILPQDWRKVKI